MEDTGTRFSDLVQSSSSSTTKVNESKRRSVHSTLAKTFRRHGTFCDLALFAGPDSQTSREKVTPILAHRVILSSSCEYFRNKLILPLSDKMESNSTNHMFIEGIQRDCLEILIDYLYTGTLDYIVNKMSSLNTLDLLDGARILGLDEVVNLCESQMWTRCQPTIENCIDIVSWTSGQSGWQTLLESSLTVLFKDLQTILKTEKFLKLSNEIVQLIIMKGIKSEYCSTQDLLLAIACWLKYKPEDRTKFLSDMLKHFPVKENQGLLYKIFIEDMEEKCKKLLYGPMMTFLMTTIASKDKTTTTPSAAAAASVENGSKSLAQSPRRRNCSSLSSQNGLSSDLSRVKKRNDRQSPLSRTPSPPSRRSRQRKNDSSRSYRNDDDESYPTSTSKEGHGQITIIRSCFRSRSPPKSLETDGQEDFSGIIYFFTHNEMTDKRELKSYDIKLDSYSTLAAVSKSRPWNSTLFYHREKIYVLGGKEKGHSITYADGFSDVWTLSLKTKIWDSDAIPRMKKGRFHFPAVILDGSLYVIGGVHRTHYEENIPTSITCVERIFLGHPTWWENMPYIRGIRNTVGAAVLKGKIYVVGGGIDETKNWHDATDLVECFDPKRHIWTDLPPMNQKRTGICVVATNNFLYAIGGHGTNESENRLASVEVYCPVKKEWHFAPPMIKERRYASGVYWKEKNAIYVIGGDRFKNVGVGKNKDFDPTIEKLDLTTMTWKIVTDLRPDGNYCSVAFR